MTTERDLMRNLFKTSNETPYREFREAMQIENMYEDPFEEYYDEKLDDLLSIIKFDVPEGMDVETYKKMHLMEMVLIFLFPETVGNEE